MEQLPHPRRTSRSLPFYLAPLLAAAFFVTTAVLPPQRTAGAASSPARIAFRYLDNGSEITSIDYLPLSGGSPRQVAVSPVPSDDMYSPSWSPDGQTLAYLASAPGKAKVPHQLYPYQVVVTQPDGHNVATYDHGYAFTGAVAWAPDGKEIAYECLHGQLFQYYWDLTETWYTYPNLCVLNIISGVSTVIAKSTGTELLGSDRVSWSSTGKTILIDATHCEAPPPTGSCDPGAFAEVAIAHHTVTPFGPSDSHAPQYSPNGAEIAYTQTDPKTGQETVKIMAAGGGKGRTIFQGGDVYGRPTLLSDPAWSPDAKDLVFSSNLAPARNDDLFTISVKGGKPKDFTNLPAYSGGPSWSQPLTLCTVPALKGQTLASATKLLELAGCALGKVTGPTKNRNKLHVFVQDPTANKNVPVGTKVSISLK